MKRKPLILAVILCFSILPLLSLVGCNKDTTCYLKVKVIDESSRTPIPQAVITISQSKGSIRGSGVTDINGEYKAQYDAPAILNVDAVLYVNGGERRGGNSVTLEDGIEKTVVITMTSDIFYN